MALISGVLLLKGALFISKTASLKAVLAKYGVHYLATHTIAATVTAATTVTTAAGLYVVASSIPKQAVNGFTKTLRGIENKDYLEFAEGIIDLSSTYSSTQSLLADFYIFIDGYQGSINIKESLKKTINDIKPLIESEIENKTFELIKHVDKLVREKGLTPEAYSKQINQIYNKHTFDLMNYCSYNDFLGRCGRIYSDLSNLNIKYGIKSDPNEYDHYLAYCIAGWLINNINLPCMQYKSQRELAGDITDQIFNYLRAYNLT